MDLQQSEKDVQEIYKDNTISQHDLKNCCIREGCQNIENYKRLNRIHEGVYGVVFRALQIPTSQIYAVKKLKINQGEDFPITSLRQISIGRSLNHPNIIKITRVAGNQKRDKVYIIMEYIQNELKQLLKEVQFNQSQVKKLMKDLLEGINYLHDRNIVHRDLKTSNLLYSNEGILKICDFGLARRATKALMTQQIITMWYRPPQLFLDTVNYSTEVDIWSIGCIMAEIILRAPLFKGKSQLEQLNTIFKIVGSPTQQTWKQFKSMKNSIYISNRNNPKQTNKLRDCIPIQLLNDQGINLLQMMLIANPKKRITAKKALLHPWFKSGVCQTSNMPKHQSLNQLDRVKKKVKHQ